MSKIDLERLVVRQTYFIPVKSPELKTAIRKELRAANPDIDGLAAWILPEEHKLSFHFLKRMKYISLFAETWGMKRKTRKFKTVFKEKSKEFEELGDKAFHRGLKKLIPSIPLHLFVSVIRIEENGCLCNVECLPALYEKLRRIENIKTNDFEMQDAYLTCKRFLRTIFESGLSATLVVEEKKEVFKSSTQLLINDQTSREILHKIENMLDQATGEVLICGWIGTILLPKLKEIWTKGVNI